MKKLGAIRLVMGCILLGTCLGCASSGTSESSSTTPLTQVIRAPVDFISNVTQKNDPRFSPKREFQQNWEDPDRTSEFWESDDQFFASYRNQDHAP